MNLGIFCEPDDAYAARRQAQANAAATARPAIKMPRLDSDEKALLEWLQNAEYCKTMSLISAVVADLGLPSRAAGRVKALELIEKLKHLRQLGLVFSVGRNSISSTPVKRPPRIRRRRLSVSRTGFTNHVSGVGSAFTSQSSGLAISAETPQNQVEVKKVETSAPTQNQAKTKTVPPEVVSAAAQRLAQLPRNLPRKLTGYVDGVRSWSGQTVVFSDGTTGSLIRANRGRLLIDWHRPDGFIDDWSERAQYELLRHFAAREGDVKRTKNPQAQLLGRLKAGVRERPSAAKANAARQNGGRPVKPGNRPRGRPRKIV